MLTTILYILDSPAYVLTRIAQYHQYDRTPTQRSQTKQQNPSETLSKLVWKNAYLSSDSGLVTTRENITGHKKKKKEKKHESNRNKYFKSL